MLLASLGNTAFGFDLKLDQLSKVNSPRLHGAFVETVARLHAAGWKIIHLRRLNLFRQCLSNRLARARRVWHGSDEDRLAPLRIAPEELFKDMVYFEKLVAWETQALGELPRLDLVYERDLLDSAGHAHAPVRTTMRKVAAANPAEDIVNYAELADHIRGTRFAAFVDA